MRAKASICPHIFGVVVMHIVFKGEVFDFIGHILMKNWMLLYEWYQDWF